MFENVIGNKSVIKSLKEDIQSKHLPPAILLAGGENTGKLTTALEIARIINCKNEGKWNCNCSACAENRTLTLSDLLIMGEKNCTLEIKAASKVLLKTKSRSSYYLFLRAIKKLTIRFSSELWQTSDANFSKATSILPEIEETLAELRAKDSDIEEKLQSFQDKKLESIVLSLEKKCDKLQEECMYDSIPVSQVREAIVWLHLKAGGRRKILIVENAQKMQESARNAFLKVLEEPPEYAMFILTTQNKNAIMPTILSRVRPYIFAKRSEDEEYEVLKRVFKEDIKENVLEDRVSHQFSPLQSFFLQGLPVGYETIKQAAYIFLYFSFLNRKKTIHSFQSLQNTLDSLLEENDVSIEHHSKKDLTLLISNISTDLNKFKPSIVYMLFLKSILDVLQSSIAKGDVANVELEAYQKASKAIETARGQVEIYNMSSQNVLLQLIECLKECFI